MTVNGERRTAVVEDRATLAEFVREGCGLTGTHLACEHGVCGACTVLRDGDAVRSCLVFAAQLEGADVTTIEGLSPADGSLSPVQQAFADHHGLHEQPVGDPVGRGDRRRNGRDRDPGGRMVHLAVLDQLVRDRQRLRDGKIYHPDKIQTALSNFFTDENLTTLRELALREVASSVDRSREEIVRRAEHGGVPAARRTVDRVMACLSSDPPLSRVLLRKAPCPVVIIPPVMKAAKKVRKK